MEYSEWVNNHLVPRLVNYTQSQLGKVFYYDLSMAYEATTHAEDMAKNNLIYHPPNSLIGNATSEVIGSVIVQDDRYEDALFKIVSAWLNSKKHKDKLEKYSSLGVGIAVVNYGEPGKNHLYATLRLK